MTVSDEKEATKIAHILLKEKLIACANIVDPISSFFWWEGKIDKANEFLVIMKSRKSLFKKLSEKVKELHSYEVPEIIALSVIEGLPSYLNWLGASLLR
jgi:periplasmic divalent cation tolerance protein